MKILIAYASAHGSTADVAEFIGQILKVYDVEIDVRNVKDVTDVSGYDLFILGTAIHSGLWLQEMCQLVDNHAAQLALKPMYFWVNCIRAVEADGIEHAKEYYIDHAALAPFDVREVKVFTGKLNTDDINWQERWLLASDYDGKLIPGRINYDFRDWYAITEWANTIAKAQGLKPAFPPLEVDPVSTQDTDTGDSVLF